jgi:hypothetical protein
MNLNQSVKQLCNEAKVKGAPPGSQSDYGQGEGEPTVHWPKIGQGRPHVVKKSGAAKALDKVRLLLLKRKRKQGSK